MEPKSSSIDWSKWDNPYVSPRQYQKPQTEISVYGYPVTVDEYRGPASADSGSRMKVRLALWMEGEARRTKPLVEEHLDYDEFRRLIDKTARKSRNRYNEGREANFLIEWYHQNKGEIEKARHRRSGFPVSYYGLDGNTPVDPIPTRTFTGEDGQTYTELSLADEDTDPVLLNATMNRDQILAEQKLSIQRELDRKAREAAEKAELQRLERERQRLEQEELEAMPGWGAF